MPLKSVHLIETTGSLSTCQTFPVHRNNHSLDSQLEFLFVSDGTRASWYLVFEFRAFGEVQVSTEKPVHVLYTRCKNWGLHMHR